MMMPLYTLDTFYFKYSRKENWFEDGPLTTLSNFEISVVRKIKAIMRKRGYSYVNKRFSYKMVKGAYPGTEFLVDSDVFECLFSDIYGYFSERCRCLDKEIDDALPGVKVDWYEYYDSRGNLTRKSVLRKYPSGDVTKTIFNNKGHIDEITMVRGDVVRFTEFKIDVNKRIKQMKRRRRYKKAKRNEKQI
jgi:hypothetical protein